MQAQIGGALLPFAIAGLTLVLRRHIRNDGGGRRRPAHASGNEPRWVYPDHPSWPAGSTGSPLTPDHPSWPASDIGRPLTSDHPSWPASDIGRPIGYSRHGGTPAEAPYDDHPSWPANGPARPVASEDYPGRPAAGPEGSWAPSAAPPAGHGPGGPRRDLAGEPPAVEVHHDPYPPDPAPHVPPARGRHMRGPAGYSGPGVSTEDTPQRWSAKLARNPGPIPQTYYDLAFGDGRLQVVLTEPPGGDPGWAAGPSAGAGGVLQLPGPGAAGRPDSWDYGNADSVRVAERVLADADQHAAAIRQEATSQAVAIRDAAEREAAKTRQQAAAEATPIREAAEREAAEIKEQAAAQVAAIREAAEREIAELRATVLAMSDELRRVAAHVTETLTSPGLPAVPPPRRAGPHAFTAAAEPDAGPAVQPAARPATAPRTRPPTRPATPAAKPARRTETPTRSRQYRSMRVFGGTIAALVILALGAGAYQVATRGFTFFTFRSAGTGATDNNAIFPGIIPTPKPSPADHDPTGPGKHGAPGAHHRHHRGTQHH